MSVKDEQYTTSDDAYGDMYFAGLKRGLGWGKKWEFATEEELKKLDELAEEKGRSLKERWADAKKIAQAVRDRYKASKATSGQGRRRKTRKGKGKTRKTRKSRK
jgi:hypothetical protein